MTDTPKDPHFVDPASHLADASSPYGFSGGDILHPSDMSLDEGRAFAHALAIALRIKSRLTILRAGPPSKAIDVETIPHVREILNYWGLLPRQSSRGDVFKQLGVEIKKITKKSAGPVDAIQDHLAKRKTDLVVMATRGQGGLPGWLSRSVSGELAKDAQTRVLYVPSDARGFVTLNGEIHLKRVLVPLAQQPDPRIGVLAASRLAQVLGAEHVQFIALHVGEGDNRPDVELPRDGWSWESRQGSAAREIVAAANERSADVIVMSTEGSQGLVDNLIGSTTRQVLRDAPCPVLAVPSHMFSR